MPPSRTGEPEAHIGAPEATDMTVALCHHNGLADADSSFGPAVFRSRGDDWPDHR